MLAKKVKTESVSTLQKQLLNAQPNTKAKMVQSDAECALVSFVNEKIDPTIEEVKRFACSNIAIRKLIDNKLTKLEENLEQHAINETIRGIEERARKRNGIPVFIRLGSDQLAYMMLFNMMDTAQYAWWFTQQHERLLKKSDYLTKCFDYANESLKKRGKRLLTKRMINDNQKTS